MYKSATRKRAQHHDYDLTDDLAKVRDALADAAIGAKGKAGDMLIQSILNAKERSADLQDNITSFVKKRPYKIFGVAIVSGLILGLLLNRK